MIIYAPNVHTGGGFQLLESLVRCAAGNELLLILDSRASSAFRELPIGDAYWVKRTLLGRLFAEVQLHKQCKMSRDALALCFHGLPPLLRRTELRSVVFLQNRLYVENIQYSHYPPRIAMRLCVERILFRLFHRNVHTFIVQTPSMARALEGVLKRSSEAGKPRVVVAPFMNPLHGPQQYLRQKRRDFIYVADGAGHKNHRMLVQAWIELAKRNIRPSLALTLGERDTGLLRWIQPRIEEFRLNIVNLGNIRHSEVLSQYAQSGSLIFPSYTESFGLPLIEASRLGMPILAPELDYVRDVCTPAETFDPSSAISIARAVERHLGGVAPALKVHTPGEFLAIIAGLVTSQASAAGRQS